MDAEDLHSIAYYSGIIILVIAIFLLIGWGIAEGISSPPNAVAIQACVILLLLGGISAFTGGVIEKLEWERGGREASSMVKN